MHLVLRTVKTRTRTKKIHQLTEKMTLNLLESNVPQSRLPKINKTPWISFWTAYQRCHPITDHNTTGRTTRRNYLQADTYKELEPAISDCVPRNVSVGSVSSKQEGSANYPYSLQRKTAVTHVSVLKQGTFHKKCITPTSKKKNRSVREESR